MSYAARLLALCGFWLPLPLLAQAPARAITGFSLGRTWAAARYPTRAGVRSRTSLAGMQAGIFTLRCWGHLAIQPGLRYTQLGDQLDGEFPYDASTSYHETRRLNYLQLPLLGLYSFRIDGQGLQLFAGPYGGWLVGGSYREQIGRNPKINTVPVTEGGRWDLGLQAGVGYRFRGLLAQAGYGWGLLDRRVPDVLDSEHGAGGRSYNRAWHLSLLYGWDLSGSPSSVTTTPGLRNREK